MFERMNIELSKINGFYVALLFTTLFSYPIISSSVYYIDDLARSQVGFLGWGSLGRPLADYIFFIFTLKNKVSVDVSPLPQILSVFLMAYTISYISKKLFKENTVTSIASSSLIFINPLFLHNLVYRYDSLSMVMSVSLCVFACFYHNKNKLISFVTKSLLIFGSLCLYQVSAVCFAMITLIYYSVRLVRGDALRSKEVGFDILVILTSYLVYFITISRGITSSRSETIFSQSNWLDLLVVNLRKFYNMYSGSFNEPVVIIILIAIIFCSLFYLLNLRDIIKNQNSLLIKLLCVFLVLSPLLLIIASTSTIVILKESLILPRIATPFGLILIYCSSIIYVKSKNASLSYSLTVLFFSIVISFSLSSAMNDQYSIDKSLISQIKQSIESDKTLRESKTTTFGTANESLVAKTNSRVFPVVGMINSKVYDATASIMLTRFGLNNVNFSFDRKEWMGKAISICSTTMPKIKNDSYAIYNKDKQSYVFLGKTPSICI